MCCRSSIGVDLRFGGGRRRADAIVRPAKWIGDRELGKYLVRGIPRGLSLALMLLCGLGGPPGCARTDTSSAPGTPQAEQCADRPLPVDARIERDPHRNTIRFLKSDDLSEGLDDAAFESAANRGAFDRLAIAYLAAHRSAFRLEDPARELRPKQLSSDDLGMTHVKLQQVFREVPILGAELVVHFRGPRTVYLVNGSYVRTPMGLDTTPRLSSDDARAAAVADVPSLDGRCEGCTAELVIFPVATDAPRLAWRVVVSPSLARGWEFIVDAGDGTLLQKLPTSYETGSLRRNQPAHRPPD